MAARVQIPASPLETLEESTLRGFCYAVLTSLQIVLNCEKWQRTVYTTAYKRPVSTAYIGETYLSVFTVQHTTPQSGEYIAPILLPENYIQNPNNFTLVRTTITW